MTYSGLQHLWESLPIYAFIAWSLILLYFVATGFEGMGKQEEEEPMLEPEEMFSRALERQARKLGLDPNEKVDRQIMKLIVEGKVSTGRVGLHGPQDTDKETRSKQRPKN